MKKNFNWNRFWSKIDTNCQKVAEREELVLPGEHFKLTPDQEKALAGLDDHLVDGTRRMVLKGPTGSGKTEVWMRTAVREHLELQRSTWILAPTRDLLRQHMNYLSERLHDTMVSVAEIHGGIAPKQRERTVIDIEQGRVGIVLGTAMLLEQSKYRRLLDEAAVVIVDDVNAFDEEEHLRHLRRVVAPIVYISATPEAVSTFLHREGALENIIEMQGKPFNCPPTLVHKVPGALGESVYSQLDRALPLLRKHVEAGSRIYVVSRTRSYVPLLADYVERLVDVPVSILHGDMADTQEHRKRMRKFRGKVSKVDRQTMMLRFKKSAPAVMVATNLIGSGLDIPLADLVIITDADHFGEAEIEQLVGRVGRRERESDAFLVTGTTLDVPAGSSVKARSTVKNGQLVMSFSSRGGGGRRMARR